MHLVILGILLSFTGGCLFPSTVAAEACEEWVAKAESVQGSIQVRRAGKTQWTPVQQDDTFCPGDTIRVKERSRLAIVAQNETVHRLDENTTITITAPEQKQTFWLNLRAGAAYFFSRVPQSLKVLTPFVNAGVEGTEFFVKVERDQTFLSVFEGRVTATNAAGSLTLASSQSAIVKAGQAPALRVVVRPRDAVQWALYYPPILDFRPSDFPGEATWQAMVRQSIEFYRQGDLPRAFASLAGAPKDVRDPRFFTNRAALMLTVGRVDAAQVDIKRALKLDPRNGHAVALRSIIAVVQSRKDEALRLARKAVELEPASAAARVALSYARQARFDLQGALASLQEAVTLPPDNALVWARLAELWLSVGDLKKALEAAQRAVALNPRVARTQTILGFAFLTQIKIQDAKAAFENAIQLDQSAPLPRLGLGLAQIRQGDLKEGRGEMAIAASLDPNNSLIRSYLGKAYFALNRPKEAWTALERAKVLDPKDPTPYYYAGIYMADENRPGAAIREFQRSIALNDNRAVFRSRFLLDRDVAARGADLARPYRLLGLDQLAEHLALNALEDDPTSSSAHAFLAAIARDLHPRTNVSNDAFIQTFLFSPVSSNALHSLNRFVSPSPTGTRGSKGDFTVSGFNLSNRGSISDRLRRERGRGLANFATSFGEYTSLFESPAVTLSVQGAYESHNTNSESILSSGGTHRLAASLFAERFSTDGFRDTNNEMTDYEINSLFKYALDPQSDLSFAAVYSNLRTGDVFQDANAFVENDPNLRVQQELFTFHLGYHRHFTPGSHLLALVQGGYSPARFKNKEEGLAVPVLFGTTPCEEIVSTCQGLVSIDEKIRSRPYFYDFQLQHQHRLGNHRLLIGGEYLRIKESISVEDILTSQIVGFEPEPIVLEPLLLEEKENPLRSFISFYIQHIWEITPKWHLTMALRYDYAEDSRVDVSRVGLPRVDFEQSELSPQFGLTFRPNPHHSFRLAVLKFFQPEKGIGVIPSLAPTQVAGVILNQASSIFFPSARGWQYQAAWEFRPISNAFFRFSLFRLDIDAPFQKTFFSLDDPSTFSTQIAQDSFSRTGVTLAWNQLLTESLGLSVEYRFVSRSGMSGALRSLLFERPQETDEDAFGEGKEDDHQVRLKLSFVHPAGWLARVRTTFIHQELGSGIRSPGAPEDFWWVDLSLTKQFWKRRASITFAVDNLMDERFQLVSDALMIVPGETLTGFREPARRFSGVVTVNF